MATVARDRVPAAEGRWRAAFGPDEVVQRIRPAEDKGYIPNPHRGTATFQRFNGDPLNPGLTWSDKDGPVEFKPFNGNLKNPQYPDSTLAYCRWVWAAIEPEKGRYRWDIIDGALEAARARGQTLQARLQPYAGGSGLPPWFWLNRGRPDRQRPGFDASADRRKWEPDHNHPSYLAHWGDLIRAFGERYDGHSVLESFDVAYGGSCGECGGNTEPATARRLVDVYRESLPRTQLISMLDTDGCTYGATFGDMGWRHDCFGDMRDDGCGVVPNGQNWNHMYDDIPRWVAECGVSDSWRTAPVIFETCWTVGYWARQGWNIDWILEQGLKYHATAFMPKSSFIPDPWREKIDAFDRRLGYRFVLRQVNLPLEARPRQTIPFWIWIENVGVAPLYRPYVLAFRFRQGKTEAVVRVKTDLRTWMPGDTVIDARMFFPKTLKPGEVEVDIGIVDETMKEAKVLFAIQPRREDRWHPLSRMDVIG